MSNRRMSVDEAEQIIYDGMQGVTAVAEALRNTRHVQVLVSRADGAERVLSLVQSLPNPKYPGLTTPIDISGPLVHFGLWPMRCKNGEWDAADALKKLAGPGGTFTFIPPAPSK